MTRPNSSMGARNAIRAIVWRLGRSLYCRARGEFPNDQPAVNGEYWLLSQSLRSPGGEMVVCDVGANKGDWTIQAFHAAMRGGGRLRVHAFEPCAGTRDLLVNALSKEAARGRCVDAADVTIHACALSSSVGEAYFYSSETGGLTSSLSNVSGENRELVRLSTLDAFMAEAGIQHIDMVKIDTEGYDFDVLKGGVGALSEGAIEVVQFEYNWRWLITHSSLRDVFEYLEGKPYHFGKLAGDSIEIFDRWHFELDRFFENNYVLIRHGSRLLSAAGGTSFDRTNCVRSTGAFLSDARRVRS